MTLSPGSYLIGQLATIPCRVTYWAESLSKPSEGSPASLPPASVVAFGWGPTPWSNPLEQVKEVRLLHAWHEP